MESLDELRGPVEIERERTEQANSGFHSDLDPDPGYPSWDSVRDFSTDEDTDDDGEALYNGKVIDEEKETNCPAEPVLGHREPEAMLQVFSLCLSRSEGSYPISVYGIVAVRDDLEPLRNHVFRRSRDDAVMIEQDSFTLPLCTPCRGMYVLEDALLEVDLWVKKEGDGSADKQLLSAYVEISVLSDFDFMLKGQISTESCSLAIEHMFLSESVEAVIEVFAKCDHPHHLRFSAFSSGFDREIVMLDDKCYMDEKTLKHVVAVKSKGKLDVHLKIDKSLFCWAFQDGAVGPVTSPDHSISVYGQFIVRVFFAPKDMQPSSGRTYRDWLKLDPIL
ncbi:unnamed protein product [Alopecurus aequalis]